jgi:predicted ATPase with chaperone activity
LSLGLWCPASRAEWRYAASHQRQYCACTNLPFGRHGGRPHVGRTTINLAPANIRKEGPCFDLPIAAGILATQEEISGEALAAYAMIGELALSGEVRRVKGVLPIAMRVKEDGLQGLLVPTENAEEAVTARNE